MARLADRFEAKVDCSGDHHVWTASAKADGTGPLFRWAKRRGIVARSPMADFELPTSRHVAREHVPPEVDQLCRYLETAVEVVPDVAPVLSLGTVTGMRRGELVSLRRSRLFPSSGKLRVDAAYASGRRVKATKTREEREVAIDPDTMEMLLRHCALMDERAAVCGVEVPEDGFVFSLEPTAPDRWRPTTSPSRSPGCRITWASPTSDRRRSRSRTRRSSCTAASAYRAPRGRSGPDPAGAVSSKELGRRLGRSERWTQLAVASAERWEAADAGRAGARRGAGRAGGGHRRRAARRRPSRPVNLRQVPPSPPGRHPHRGGRRGLPRRDHRRLRGGADQRRHRRDQRRAVGPLRHRLGRPAGRRARHRHRHRLRGNTPLIRWVPGVACEQRKGPCRDPTDLGRGSRRGPGRHVGPGLRPRTARATTYPSSKDTDTDGGVASRSASSAWNRPDSVT